VANGMFGRVATVLKLTRWRGIARRYFVVNGFDGALTMLGLIVGFHVSGEVELAVVINACLGAAVALGVSGVSSAYISEVAEKRRELRELERAMAVELESSAYGRAARLLPLLIALVNGLAPLVLSLLIIAPLWLAHYGVALPLTPLETALGVALVLIFLLGVFLGRVSGVFWLWAGLRTLLIAVATGALVFLLTPR
jgi:predicted membrane protein (TIGR00267 family)